MLAIIKTGGKQYLVREGQSLSIEKIEGKSNSKIVFDQVLLLIVDEKVQIGTPKVKDAKVTATLLETKKDKKIRVFKFKAKKRYKKLRGHRQLRTKVKIEKF